MNETTKLFAVVGNPVLHSKSPVLFEGAYPGAGDRAFFRLVARSAEEALRLLSELELGGMNVTAPFKTEMAALVARRSVEVEILDAANTVVSEADGFHAYNTDPCGVSGAIEALGVEIRAKECLVLGAGGAGRAAAYALQRAGGCVTLVNRTIDKVREIAGRLHCMYAGIDDELPGRVARAEIVVHALSPGVEVIEEEWLSPRHVVLDALYHGSYLRDRAMRRGATYIDGSHWLIHQGIPAYRLFTGEEPDERGMEMALSLLPALPRHVSFIGFMGAGKSTVARTVGKMLGMPVVDTDRLIEQRAGKGIPRLMQEEGEASFRVRELEVLRDVLLGHAPAVISCGGGAVLLPEARRLLRSRSIVVWLYASPEQCMRRIDVASRPLLACHARPDEAAEALFRERKALYARTAWMLIDTGGRTSKQVSQVVYEEISRSIRG
ncbi:MAG: hypothetical protein LBP56_00715 [Odoribacteraceae bacterium]|jgi:shikimate dehydrogenase|nr:hypothetical protein [Odoribacteraceae bacterium]